MMLVTIQLLTWKVANINCYYTITHEDFFPHTYLLDASTMHIKKMSIYKAFFHVILLFPIGTM